MRVRMWGMSLSSLNFGRSISRCLRSYEAERFDEFWSLV